MDKNFFKIIFNISYLIILSTAILFLSFDFLNFLKIKQKSEASNYASYDTKIYGNHFLPEIEVIKKINKDNSYNNIYDHFIKDLKTIQISKKNKIIVINENKPIFCDYQNIYFEKNKQFKLNKFIENKEDLVFVDIYTKKENEYEIGLKKMESFINYLRKNEREIHNNLERIEIDEDSFLSIYLNGCKIKMFKVWYSYSKINLKEMKDKIKVLLAFINNEELNIDSIEEINLSMEDDGLIIWQERLNKI